MYEIFLISFFVLVVGACIGSFLNVVALRALSDESIVFPNSKCPSCSTPIKWYDNIPVLSYFLTFKGKCRSCGCKVSIQYPIVEALTAILFLACVIAFGLTLKTLFILILLCLSIVLSITDIKEHITFNVHLWIFIGAAIVTSLYLHGLKNWSFTVLGLIAGIVVMEIIARGAYYFLKKAPVNDEKNETTNETNTDNEVQSKDEKNEENEENEIKEYIKKKKRVFGEGDTYLTAAAGALLGWKYAIVVIIFAIVLQAVCLVPSVLKGLYEQKQYKLLVSLSVFLGLSLLYWILFNIIPMNTTGAIVFVVILAAIAFYVLKLLRNTIYEKGFSTIPFGPAILVSMFIMLFWGPVIVKFIRNYIWLSVL